MRLKFTTLPARDSLNDAADDERFNTFFRRLAFFKLPKETDQAFCKRIGVPFSQFRGWKYRGYLPPHSVIQHLGDVLNVCGAWLWFGLGHKISYLPRGLRLTAIPRPTMFVTDHPDGQGENPMTKLNRTAGIVGLR